jgi:hypothetical protein
MRKATLQKYSELMECLLNKNSFDIREELSKRKLSQYISTSLVKLNLIKRIDIGVYVWNVSTMKSDAESIAKMILTERMAYDKIQRSKKKKTVQAKLPLQIPNKLTVEQCINFLKSQTDYTYEIYRIERNQL